MWELTLRGNVRPGQEEVLADTQHLTALATLLAVLAGPGQSDYHPAVTATDGGVSAVCEFPGGAVGVDTYSSGRVRVQVTSSEAFDDQRAIVAVINALPMFRYTAGWAQPG